MKRVALLCMGLVMGAANAAEAQLTMQMSNGWSFTFGGNVNAFLVYEKPSDNAAPTVTPGGIVAAGGEGAPKYIKVHGIGGVQDIRDQIIRALSAL